MKDSPKLEPPAQPGVTKEFEEIPPAPAQPRSTRVLGRCRRHAPTMSGYPVVTTQDWCGDHKLATGTALAQGTEDAWAHRERGMRCSSCMFFVEKRT